MNDVVFVRTQYEYQSYSDLWRLVELSGIPWIHVKDFDLTRDYIGILPVCNGELRPHIVHRRSILKSPQLAKLIFWNLERPDSGDHELSKITPAGVANSTNEILEYVDAMWVSDKYWTSLDPRLIHVSMGSDPRLAGGGPLEKIYDACALSYNNYRREQVYIPMSQQLRMPASFSAWGVDRDRILRSSKCMAYVHQTPMPIGAPLRMALAAAYRLPVISERLADPYPHEDGFDVVLADYAEILPKTRAWLNDGRLPGIGENLYQKLCVQMPFEKCVREGLKRTLTL